jgi:hypothetical protein
VIPIVPPVTLQKKSSQQSLVAFVVLGLFAFVGLYWVIFMGILKSIPAGRYPEGMLTAVEIGSAIIVILIMALACGVFLVLRKTLLVLSGKH